MISLFAQTNSAIWRRRGTGAALSVGLLAVSALAPAFSASSVQSESLAPTAPVAGLIAEYLFDDGPMDTVPNSAPDASHPEAVLHSTRGDDWNSSSLTLRGGAKTGDGNWVELPADLLTDQEHATVSIEVKASADVLQKFHFLWTIGNETTDSYAFASLNCGSGRRPLTGLKVDGVEELVQASSCTISADQWTNVTAVFEDGTARLYLDGEPVAQRQLSADIGQVWPQSVNTIGRAPWPDELFEGAVAAFRVYDRALSQAEVTQLAQADALLNQNEIEEAAREILEGLPQQYITNGDLALPTVQGRIVWSSSDSGVVSETGFVPTTSQVRQAELTATVSIRGLEFSRVIPVTVQPDTVDSQAGYGYLMVHFVEDSDGYAEKIYLSISRGNDPQHWDRLNGGEPILASNLGTTGVRDPFLTYNPGTRTYYIIATDLRVFGSAECPSDNCWGDWQLNGSSRLNIWESKDLVTWTDFRQIEVSPPTHGMSWAPEATWVPGLNDGAGGFIVYWSSTIRESATSTEDSYSRVVWGSTTDFTQESYAYGGVMIDTGGNAIDTTLLQIGSQTYRFTKDNDPVTARGIYVESTEVSQWWLPETEWDLLQTRIGMAAFGEVEGPATFAVHGGDQWYLLVDDYPTPGYRPFVSADPPEPDSWLQADQTTGGFSLPDNTKHGGVIGLTRVQYDALRAADIAEIPDPDLGEITVTDSQAIVLPADIEVRRHFQGMGRAVIEWDPINAEQLQESGSVIVTGSVVSLGANLNHSTSNIASEADLISTTALPKVQVRIVLDEQDHSVGPVPSEPGPGGQNPPVEDLDEWPPTSEGGDEATVDTEIDSASGERGDLPAAGVSPLAAGLGALILLCLGVLIRGFPREKAAACPSGDSDH